MKNLIIITVLIGLSTAFGSCSKTNGCTDPNATNYNANADKDDGSCLYDTSTPTNPSSPTSAQVVVPAIFAQTLPAPLIPSNNPLSVEGIELGRKLFFDKQLSGDGTLACAGCHTPELAFTDTNQFSTGITGMLGGRNSMPIFNVAWNFSEEFFWDGRASSVENQALGPVVNPIEMNNTWVNAVATLQADLTYPGLFLAAFGTSTIDSNLVTKAIAQFERTIVSGNSKFDSVSLGLVALTPSESNGFALFMDGNKADCFHCHGSAGNPLWTDNLFHNNGLDATFTDLGLGAITGNAVDNGKFKTPSLRNLAFSAPYMHDGRFATLDDVLAHYNTGVLLSPTIDPLMQFSGQGGVQLTPSELTDLKAFLLTLTDYTYINNPAYQAPQ